MGTIKLKGREVHVFGGYGDMQAALLGASIEDKAISINLGTGSQVAKICADIDNLNYAFDFKPFFGKFLDARTHIPAGRSLEYLNKTIFKDEHFWKNINNIRPQTLEKFDKLVEFDLNIFPGNWRYNKKNLELIKKSSLNLDDMYVALLKAFCDQYIELVDLFRTKNLEQKIIISGGRLKDIPAVKSMFSQLSNDIKYSEKEGIDETLLGLNKISITDRHVV
jgi:sugar (pentulose or hexulose) kinase